MRRSFGEILWQESPILLAREALWRTQKQWRKKKLLARIDDECPTTFRPLDYYANRLPNLSDKSKSVITAYADEIGHGRFPFLGYGTRDLGLYPNWTVDFVSGVHWAELKPDSNPRVSGTFDIKVPWELSRLQFLPIIGKAYVLTSNEQYREYAKRLTSDWIAKNPVGVGVNWSVAMEAALRAMSICFLLTLLAPFRQDEQDWLKVVTRCLWQHMLFIEAHAEFSHLISSNHYLSNIVGLHCLCELLEGAGMEARRRMYREKIECEILRQTYEDGGDYEASTGYHVLVTQMFTSALLLMRAANTKPHPSYIERLRRMYKVIEVLVSASGQLPHVGDCDDGRVELLMDDLEQMTLLPVDQRNSLRISNLLGLGSYVLGGSHGSIEDAKWYAPVPANRPSCEIDHAAPALESMSVLANSGMSIAITKEAEVLFFAVPNGIGGKGSHNHNDKLSFILRLDGQEVFCDPGTCSYTRDPKIRNRFRATAAHNTLLIDGQEQNTFRDGRSGLFSMGKEAEVSLIAKSSADGNFILRAHHTGYKRLGITHTRTLRLSTTETKMTIEDELTGTGAHRIEINFHLAPVWKISSVQRPITEVGARVSGRRELQLIVRGLDQACGRIDESLMSTSYGATARCQRLNIKGELTLPGKVTTTISWENSKLIGVGR